MKPLVVIVGPTASGKTAFAIELAKKFNGEIIAADSRTIYKGMDIGTAKPSDHDRKRVPHFGIDIIEPDEPFSVSDFKNYALEKIEEIRQRGHVPFLVGGTGLYIDAVLFDYQFGPKADPEFRRTLEGMALDELQAYCKQHNVSLPENSSNKRYVIRAIEQNGSNTSRRFTPINNTIIVGITTNKNKLTERIAMRNEQLLEDGVVNEAIQLGKKYGWNSNAMTGNIYPLLHDFIDRKLSLDELKEKANTNDWQLAKRQLTWFKRDKFIHWFSLDRAKEYISDQLAQKS